MKQGVVAVVTNLQGEVNNFSVKRYDATKGMSRILFGRGRVFFSFGVGEYF